MSALHLFLRFSMFLPLYICSSENANTDTEIRQYKVDLPLNDINSVLPGVMGTDYQPHAKKFEHGSRMHHDDEPHFRLYHHRSPVKRSGGDNFDTTSYTHNNGRHNPQTSEFQKKMSNGNSKQGYQMHLHKQGQNKMYATHQETRKRKPYKKMAHQTYEDVSIAEMVIPVSSAPFPYVEETFASYHPMPMPTESFHCFLHEAPYSQCGHQSLQSLMMEQCFSFYIQMANNVEGLCSIEKAQQAFEGGYNNYVGSQFLSNADGYGGGRKGQSLENFEHPDRREKRYGEDQDQAQNTDKTEQFGPPYNSMRSELYLQEKCYQVAFLSITTAMVLCLTENIVRSTYIEHYATQAAANAIEGPILYLRKLHEFIENVLDCSGEHSAQRFPALYHEFRRTDRAIYNPNTPFKLNAYSEVRLERDMSYEAAGLKDAFIGSKFLCSNVDRINIDGYYTSLRGNPHYTLADINTCTVSAKEALGYSPDHVSKAIYRCNSIVEIDSGFQYLSDMSLRGFYDSVGYPEAESTSIHRPMTIAEIAVRNTGVLSEPILEGFGIMYFCAFFSCKAQTGNNVDDTCFPVFDPLTEWNIPDREYTQELTHRELQDSSSQIEKCKEDGWLDIELIQQDIASQAYEKALRRSYVCMAEVEITRFMKILYPGLAEDDDAHTLVYLRHIAIEKCYETAYSKCTSTSDLYILLQKSLRSLIELCHRNRAQAMRQQNRYHYKKTRL